MSKTLKAGVLGTGHLGKIHLQLLNQSNKFDLIGFYDASPDVRKKITDEYGFKAFDSEEDLIAAVDVVDIVPPTLYHHKLAKKAIETININKITLIYASGYWSSGACGEI